MLHSFDWEKKKKKKSKLNLTYKAQILPANAYLGLQII